MKLKKLILWILLSVILASCGATPQPASPSPTPARTATPNATAAATQTPTPSATPTLLFATYFTSALPTMPKRSATIMPTATPLPVITTPEAGANAYRLKPWDKAAALQMLSQAANLSISQEYADLSGFYQTSLSYEAMLDFPDLHQDAGLLQQMTDAKLSSGNSYGFVHDRSVEPFRLLLQQALNDGTMQPDTLGPWIATVDGKLDDMSYTSDRIFDQPYHTQVVKILHYGYWDYFAIRTDQPGKYSVFAIYPEWEPERWSDESFQIADINGDGKDDIAIQHEDWSTGYTHWCGKSFSLYEWDGAAFKNLMIDQPHVVLNYSGQDGCLEATWSPGPGGGNEIQIGTRRFIPCGELTYDDLITFRWNGQGYIQAPEHTIPTPTDTQPDRCTLAWAVWAGPDNPLAVDLLTTALANWPQEADQDWGPAAQDYFRLKLATWDIHLGQLIPGLKLLQEARFQPYTPAYPLSTRIAATFLDSYAANGLYRAAQDVHTLYLNELTAYTHPCVFLCTLDHLSQVWGFAEPQWGYGYPNSFTDDFQAMGALSLQLNLDHPNSQEELTTWLERNGVQPVWSIVSDLDGNGESDWLVVVKNSNPVVRNEQLRNMLSAHPGASFQTSDDQYDLLYAFLYVGGEIKPVLLDSILILSSLTTNEFGWRNFRPAPGVQPVNVLQAGTDLYAFRLVETNGAYQVAKDVESWSIASYRSNDPVVVQNWKIDAGKLVVQYNGRQAVYAWDPAQGRVAPTGLAPELQEENVGRIEQALYL